MATKNDKTRSTDRREAARLEAERLRVRAKAAERKQRLIIGVIAAVVVALIAAAGLIIWQQSQRTLLTDFEGEVPAGSDLQGGIPVGAAGAGEPNEGAPDVRVYLDFDCPHCATFEQLHGPDLAELVADGNATLIYHPVMYREEVSAGYSSRAANALATVATESPEHTVEFVAAMFEFGPGASDEEIIGIATGVGVPEDRAGAIAEGTYREWVDVASQQAQRDGAHGTPSVRINGENISNEEFGEPGSLAELILAEAG